jgi:hypothetical protein
MDTYLEKHDDEKNQHRFYLLSLLPYTFDSSEKMLSLTDFPLPDGGKHLTPSIDGLPTVFSRRQTVRTQSCADFHSPEKLVMSVLEVDS